SKTRWLDRVYPDGTWESNLFQFYRRVLPKLQEVIPTPFKLEGSLRRDDTPAHEALREAFANLCVHADYSEESSLLVYRYPHKIVFSNPGVMLISRQQYFRGGESVCRNTSLQQMFMMIGSAEKAGSGVDKILKGWETLNWKKPYPVEKAQPNKVELVMPLESLLDEAVLRELKQIFGSKMNNMDQEEIMVLSMALTEEIINNERLRDVFSLHPTDITHLLQKLCKEGFLISTGYGRGTVYRLNDTSSDGETLQVEAKNLTSTNLSDPQANVLYVTLSEGNETDLEDKTLQVKDTNLTSSEGETLQVQDANLTSSIPSRMSRAQLQEMILEFCTEWRSAEEIAEHVHRHKQYIRGEILPKMDHLLIRKFPTIEKHPGQKYKTKD
ncbi:MAG: AAA family ATPase, partial [Muribaculaceae bacterium]|nr:AAA family ATPase [Muribaculaceae bacterium]